MIKKKEVPLKIELFSSGEDSQFFIYAKKEICFILRNIAQKGTRTALYHDAGNDFILTTLLDVDEHGMWLDLGPSASDNRRILRSNKIIFVSSHQQVKVQFVAYHIDVVLFGSREAFYLPLPDTLLRLQRRDYFRLLAPVSQPLKCVIAAIPLTAAKPAAASTRREMTVMDISVGGVALACAEYDTELQPGEIYPNCQISLPDVGTMIATIRVKNVMEITTRGGVVNKHAGCEFIRLDVKMAILLQRYITRLQTHVPAHM